MNDLNSIYKKEFPKDDFETEFLDEIANIPLTPLKTSANNFKRVTTPSGIVTPRFGIQPNQQEPTLVKSQEIPAYDDDESSDDRKLKDECLDRLNKFPVTDNSIMNSTQKNLYDLCMFCNNVNVKLLEKNIDELYFMAEYYYSNKLHLGINVDLKASSDSQLYNTRGHRRVPKFGPARSKLDDHLVKYYFDLYNCEIGNKAKTANDIIEKKKENYDFPPMPNEICPNNDKNKKVCLFITKIPDQSIGIEKKDLSAINKESKENISEISGNNFTSRSNELYTNRIDEDYQVCNPENHQIYPSYGNDIVNPSYGDKIVDPSYGDKIVHPSYGKKLFIFIQTHVLFGL